MDTRTPPIPALTMEDILAAARCVALWSQTGAAPLGIACHIRDAAHRAAQYRYTTGRIHPRLGDGSVMAAALSLAPGVASEERRAVSTHDLLRALGPVSTALTADDQRRVPRV
jgi:hypothetical protein